MIRSYLLKKKLFAGLLWFYWSLCFVLTHLQLPKGPENGSDKILHFIGYSALAALFGWNSQLRQWKLKPLMAVLILAAYGAFDELTQPYFQRDADILDWTTDVAGIFFGLTLSYQLFKRVSGESSVR